MKFNITLNGSVANAIRNKTRASISKMSMMVANAWKASVEQSSLSTRAKNRYAMAITPYRSKPGAYVKDFVVKLLETGWKAFDMKPGLLAGRKNRVIPLLIDGRKEFRTVSAKSKSSSWVHPGFKGADAVKSVAKNLERLLKEAMR